MRIPDSFIQDVISRNDFESLVSSYVQVKRRGRNLVGLCPFHNEKTPSFTVYPETNSFYCFGCGAGGDIITFVRRIEHLDYLDAVKFLAERAGLQMPELQVDDTASRLRMRILEINREAARLFHHWLYLPVGKAALEYFYRRGLTDQTIKRFGLGYAPDSYHMLRDALRGKGYHDEELLAAFLCKRSSRNHNLYDIFYNRIIIPIIDVRGNVIAFGGRVLDDSKPKYINSADTPVFQKSQNLFALNFAKSALGPEKQLILCEGYMDVIALHQAGFTNAVAALGTSFTADHARLLARYADEVVLTFDADAAGQKGAGRAIPLLRQSGLRIRVLRIPEGKDPDEFIRTYGADRFRLLMQQSANDIEYQLMQLASRFAINTPDGQVQFLREAAGLLAGLSSPIEQDVYAGRLAEKLNVSKNAILQQIKLAGQYRKKQQEKRQLSQTVLSKSQAVRKVNPDAEKYLRAANAEQALIGILLQNPDFIGPISQKLPPEQMVTSFNQALYRQIVERYQQNQPLELSFFAAEYNEDQMGYIADMLRTARERENTLEEAMGYADIIQKECQLKKLAQPAELSAEEIRQMLEALKKSKL